MNVTVRRLFGACLLGLLLGIGCGTSGGTGGGSPKSASHDFAGEVTARAEGYESRPAWANENEPWSRTGDTLRIVGYVAIEGSQRIEAGNRAADSYAKAELVRFLAGRVVAVLRDRVASGEERVIEERIEETATSFVDDMSIAARYFEKRKVDDTETIHIWSRLDLDRVAVEELLVRATKDASDLRTPTKDLLAALEAKWDELADAEPLNQDDPLLPPGIQKPSWASSGDRSSADGFEFVCYGLSENEKGARALAQARCNEKLCRVFGVQIIAKTVVTEDLEGTDVETSVTEQCADVRVVDRETRFRAGECGPHGCVHWILQSYPMAAYEEEKKRLAEPAVIRQQVVIQEGGKHYKDPAECEASLRAYGAVSGWTGDAYRARSRHLTRALGSCQDIDGRESGLFQVLNTLLVRPLPNFTVTIDENGSGHLSQRAAYAVTRPGWVENLDTVRFLTDRIKLVKTVVDDAILPETLIDLAENGGTKEALDAAIKELIRFPFIAKPASPHHQYYLHDAALSRGRATKDLWSERYRTFLLEQAEKRRVSCAWNDGVSGSKVVQYFALDGRLDEREWNAAITMAKNTAPKGSTGCFSVMFDKIDHGRDRTRRIEELAKLTTSGGIKTDDESRTFESLLSELEPAERAPLFMRYKADISGPEKSKVSLAEDVTEAAFGWDWDWEREKKQEGVQACSSMPERIGSYFADVPEASTKDTGLCLCLRVEGVKSAARKAITKLLFDYGEEQCSYVKGEDWPEEYYSEPQPKYLSRSGRTVFNSGTFLRDGFERCIDEHSVIESPQVAAYVTATLAGGRMSGAKVEAVTYGELKSFAYEDKRRGFVHAKDIVRMNASLASCFTSVVNTVDLSSTHDYLREKPRPERIWMQVWGSNLGGNGYVE